MNMADQLRNQKIQICIALAMGVGAHIHRHVVYIGGEVGAMVQVKTTQVKLVGFAATAVLGHNHARDEFHDFASP